MIVERQYVNPMEMTFIGKDGSMGLRHGKTYRVLMFCADGYVWVSWNDRDDCMKVCPYASLNTLYANWKTPAPKLSNEGAYILPSTSTAPTGCTRAVKRWLSSRTVSRRQPRKLAQHLASRP